jgi:hypothetical protein
MPPRLRGRDKPLEPDVDAAYRGFCVVDASPSDVRVRERPDDRVHP